NQESNYIVLGVTRYGYPFDREGGYYSSTPEDEYTFDDIRYLKILNKNDNFNTNNLIEYIKKYIIGVINLAVLKNAKIIHAVSNYWNGLAAMYAAKFLGIKCVYEMRGFWHENISLNKNELIGTNMLKLMSDQEERILEGIDKIIV